MNRRILFYGLVLCLLFGSVQVLPAGEPYHWPVDRPTYLTSTFGEFRGDHIHNGIDFSTGGQPGRKVYSIDSGHVVRAFYDASTYGKTLIIQHRDGRRSWYSHLRSFSKRIKSHLNRPLESIEGQALNLEVSRGEVIARSGHTGRGPSHLHVALQEADGDFLNPIGFFEPKLPFNPRPSVETVRFFPLDGSSWVNGKSEDVLLKPPVKEPLKVWGRIGLDLSAFNRHSKGAIRTVPETIRLYRNGEKVYEHSFEYLSQYNQDTGVFSIYDEVYSNLNPTQFMLHATPRTEDGLWRGLGFYEANQTGTIRVEVATVRGRKKEYKLNYRTVPPPRSVAWTKKKNARARGGSPRENGPDKFKLVSLSNRQRATTQYSPPQHGNSGNPRIDLDYHWLYNRIRFDVSIENQWSGWPELTVRKNAYDTTLPLIQVKPGEFRSWWKPDTNRDGWHTVEVELGGENGHVSESDRVYLQSFEPGKPGSAVSLDGRFSLFTMGGGLQLPTAVHFREIEKLPIHSELRYVGTPRRIDPRILNSTTPLELTADLSKGVKNPERVGLYRWNPVADRWDLLSFQMELNRYTRVAKIFSGQTIALLEDTAPPEIGEPKPSSSGDYVRFDVREHGSGIQERNISARVGGEPVNFRWDSYYDALYVAHDGFDRGTSELSLIITDRAGNTSRWNGHIDR